MHCTTYYACKWCTKEVNPFYALHKCEVEELLLSSNLSLSNSSLTYTEDNNKQSNYLLSQKIRYNNKQSNYILLKKINMGTII